MTMRTAATTALIAVVLGTLACGDRSSDSGELRARQVVLRRQVEGLRQVVSRLERHEPLLPAADVGIAIDEALLRDVLAAQLPLDIDVDQYHLHLQEADVQFRGSAAVSLRGTLNLRSRPDLVATVRVLGALDDITVEAGSSTLNATVAIDHLDIEKAAGLEAFLSGATLDDVAQMVRPQLAGNMPTVQIPVMVQEFIDLPAVTRGPVRIEGAKMPLTVAVSQVVAVQNRLWIALHIEAGAVVKTADAPEAEDSTAASAEVSLMDVGGHAVTAPRSTPGRRQ